MQSRSIKLAVAIPALAGSSLCRADDWSSLGNAFAIGSLYLAVNALLAVVIAVMTFRRASTRGWRSALKFTAGGLLSLLVAFVLLALGSQMEPPAWLDFGPVGFAILVCAVPALALLAFVAEVRSHVRLPENVVWMQTR